MHGKVPQEHEGYILRWGGWQSCAFAHIATFWTFSPIKKPAHCHSNELLIVLAVKEILDPGQIIVNANFYE